jgi:hypothetical protein
MIFNDVLILQLFSIIIFFFFFNTINIMYVWYLSGLYLISLGFLMLLDDCDIFIGFLWVIDLGVGLIFFIFILHFSTFLHQKSLFIITYKSFIFVLLLVIFLISFSYLFHNPSDDFFMFKYYKNWFFFITWYDYYDLIFSYNITDLNLLREIYFYNNSFEFFIINFLLFYGIISSIIFCFLIKKFFNFLNYNEFFNLTLLNSINTNFFIRNQNFIKQQNSSTGVRSWNKKKIHNKW